MARAGADVLTLGATLGSMIYVGGALRRVRTQRHEAFDKLKSILEA